MGGHQLSRKRTRGIDLDFKDHPKTGRNSIHCTNDRELDLVLPKRKKVIITPRSLAQEIYLDALNDDTKYIVVGMGPAGTGKTKLAVEVGIQKLQQKEIEKIVITRPLVALDDRDIGYLPGTLIDKQLPWILPILDVFYEYYSKAEVEKMMLNGIIEAVPLAYIRGRTFKQSWIVLDEAQGTTVNSLKSALTRIGDGSRMVVTGDLLQSDRGTHNGLQDFIDRFVKNQYIEIISFGNKDIQRHKIVSEVLKIYGEN